MRRSRLPDFKSISDTEFRKIFASRTLAVRPRYEHNDWVFQYLDLSELNLIASNEWWDLISNEIIIDIKSTITLKAYQTMWITNY